MFKKIYGLIIILLVMLPISNYANDVSCDRELVLQIAGERNRKPFNVHIYCHDKKLVIFYRFEKQNKFIFFDESFTKNLDAQELVTLKHILLDIHNLGSVSLSPFVFAEVDRTSISLEYMNNKVIFTFEVDGNKVDTKAVQKLISFIIKKSDGKLDFLYSYDYFN